MQNSMQQKSSQKTKNPGTDGFNLLWESFFFFSKVAKFFYLFILPHKDTYVGRHVDVFNRFYLAGRSYFYCIAGHLFDETILLQKPSPIFQEGLLNYFYAFF